MTNSTLSVRMAQPNDLSILVDFVKKLAAHERRPEAATLTEQSLSPILFGSRKLADAFLLSHNGQVKAFAIVTERFSSFRAHRYLYIEDMLVLPSERGLGIGKAMLAFLGRKALERGGCGLLWSALDDNESALGFYEKIGAEIETGVVHYEMKDQLLQSFLESAPSVKEF